MKKRVLWALWLSLSGCPAEKEPNDGSDTRRLAHSVQGTDVPNTALSASANVGATASGSAPGTATSGTAPVPTANSAPCDSIVSVGSREGSSIGSATMRADGTLVLQLRAEDPASGAVGQGYFTYAPDDPRYQDKLRHLGGLEPCQSKPVPPWPD